MRRHERIPLHDHSDLNSGGLVAAHTIVSATGGATIIGGGDSGGAATGVYVQVANGGEETVYALGTLGTAATVNLVNGNYQYGTLGTACTFTFTGAESGKGVSFTLELTQDGTGGHAVSFPAAVAGGTALAAGIGTAASEVTLFTFVTRDGGSTWYGFEAGAGTASSSGSGASASDAFIWRPLLAADGTIITSVAGGEAVMGFGPA